MPNWLHKLGLREAEQEVSKSTSNGQFEKVSPGAGLSIGKTHYAVSGHGIPRTIGGPMIFVKQTGKRCQILTSFWFLVESGRISSTEPLRT